MGSEEGGGFRMGNTCIPVVESFCWGWRASSIGYPDCEEAYLRVSLTGLSCHSWGMVAAPTVPEGDGTEIQSSPRGPIWKETPV